MTVSAPFAVASLGFEEPCGVFVEDEVFHLVIRRPHGASTHLGEVLSGQVHGVFRILFDAGSHDAATGVHEGDFDDELVLTL